MPTKIGASPGTNTPVKIQGLCLDCLRPIDLRRGARLNPYNDRRSHQYWPGFDLLQPGGGRRKYSSDSGNWD
jgi:hypothetical protein